MTPRARWWAPVYLYAGLIFVLSSIPAPIPPVGVPFFDKWIHLVEYGVFGFLLARALASDSPKRLRENFRLWAIVFACLYGLSDEWHQLFVPMRQSSLWDALFDTIGASIGQFFFSSRKDLDTDGHHRSV